MTQSIESPGPVTSRSGAAPDTGTSAGPGASVAVLRRALQEIRAAKAELARQHAPVIVAGVGCRFPSANGPQEFWNLLQNGRCAVTTVPPDRWDLTHHYD
ncbi:MAG TPA: beta-ketoacyl synthase N-terminal-like domain-containing protein, partial [Kineosporiaceae bacterium]